MSFVNLCEMEFWHSLSYPGWGNSDFEASNKLFHIWCFYREKQCSCLTNLKDFILERFHHSRITAATAMTIIRTRMPATTPMIHRLDGPTGGTDDVIQFSSSHRIAPCIGRVSAPSRTLFVCSAHWLTSLAMVPRHQQLLTWQTIENSTDDPGHNCNRWEPVVVIPFDLVYCKQNQNLCMIEGDSLQLTHELLHPNSCIYWGESAWWHHRYPPQQRWCHYALLNEVNNDPHKITTNPWKQLQLSVK